jgi:cytidylate kinase
MIYLIGGRPRSGKSIIRKKILDKYKISGIGTDTLRYLLQESNPELGVHHTRTAKENGIIMWPYIDKLIEHLIKYDNENFVIEGAVLLPEYLFQYKDHQEVRVCYLGYSTISLNQKKVDIKNNGGDTDWISQYSEKEFSNFVRGSIEKSKKEKRECKRLGIKYFDIDENFEKSIEKVIDWLIN